MHTLIYSSHKGRKESEHDHAPTVSLYAMHAFTSSILKLEGWYYIQKFHKEIPYKVKFILNHHTLILKNNLGFST